MDSLSRDPRPIWLLSNVIDIFLDRWSLYDFVRVQFHFHQKSPKTIVDPE